MSRPALLAGSLLVLAGCGVDYFTGPDVEATDVEPGTPVHVASGRFVPLAYSATGSATYLIDDEGNAALELDAAFSTPDVPGRSVFLSNEPHPGGGVRVARLEDPTGPQRWTFRMPRGAVWRYVLVWSEALGVGVARAELSPRG